jgi:hypothetical protein
MVYLKGVRNRDVQARINQGGCQHSRSRVSFQITFRFADQAGAIPFVDINPFAVTNPVMQNGGIIVDCPDAYLYY